MKLFYIIILLKKPEPKNLLSKYPEIDKYRESLQENHILLRNVKAQIRDLDRQITELETRNRDLEIRLDSQTSTNISQDYEVCELESQQFLRENQEIQVFYRDLMMRYEKAQEVIEHYEQMYKSLTTQAVECEGIINSLTEECAGQKEHALPLLIGEEKPKSSLRQNFKSVLNESQIRNECPKSIYRTSQRTR